jgi:hypothetical protein
MRDRTLRASFLLAVAAAGAWPLAAAAQLRPVALTGTDGPLGPGLGPGITFSNFVLVKTVHPEFGTSIPPAPSISASGAVTFGGNLAGPGISTANGSGIFAVRGGTNPSLVARRGDQIPYLAPGYTYGELFTAPQISANNTVAFQAMVEGNDSSVTQDDATFTERSGWVFPLVREGVTLVPNAQSPGAVFGLGSNPTGDPWGNNQWVMNRHGDIALRCFVNDPPVNNNNFSGIYTDFGGPLVESSRPGQTATVNGTTYTFMGQSNPRITDSGAFMTTRLSDLTGLVPWTNRARDASNFGIPGTGPLHPLFLPGDIAPGTNAPFSSVWSLRDFSINSAGRVGFVADLSGGGPGAPGGYWSDARFGALQLIALSGAAAPGAGGATFNTNAQFVLGSALSDNNCIVLNARLLQGNGVGGGNDTGLWSTRSTTTGGPGNLRLLMREGSPVPAGSGPDFDGLNFGEIQSFWINASGRVAFTTLHNDFTRALWIEQSDGSLIPIVKEFTILDVSAGGNGSDQRLIATIDVLDGFAPTGDGRRTSFNDSGHVAVRIVFSNGSEGIFTTAPAIACSAPVESTAPQSQNATSGDTVVFIVAASGAGPIRHQWRFNGNPIAGALEATLTLTDVGNVDSGSYDCILTNPCGETTSTAATLTVSFPCPADFNNDGFVNPDDLADFITCFFLQVQFPGACPQAEFNADGFVNPDDLSDFITTFFLTVQFPCL